MVGCALASEVYATAVGAGVKGTEILADKAKNFADTTIELAKDTIPDKVTGIKTALNVFAEENHLPFNV